eukprot:1857014-Amphidinium_carterae.1
MQVQRGRGTNTELTESIKLNRWSKAKKKNQQRGRKYTELLCATCFSLNWEQKGSCRSCQSNLSASYRVVPGKWPPEGTPAAVLQQYDSEENASAADSKTAPPALAAPEAPPVPVATSGANAAGSASAPPPADVDMPQANQAAQQQDIGPAVSEVSVTSCGSEDQELQSYPQKLQALTVQGLKEEKLHIEQAIHALQAIPGLERAKKALHA